MYKLDDTLLKKSDSNLIVGLRKRNFLEFLILILVTVSPLIPTLVKLGLVYILIFVNIKKIKKINIKQLNILAAFYAIFFIGFVQDILEAEFLSDFSPLNFYFPACILLGCIISIKYSQKTILYILEKIIFFTAVFSIIGFFSYSVYPNMVSYLPSYNYYHTTHNTALFFNVLSIGDSVINRNSGIASEPGVYQLLLNIGLYAYIKNNNKTSFKKIIIYLIAIITTKSTAGLAILTFIVFYMILEKNYKTRILVVLLIAACSPFILKEIAYQYEYKLFGSYAFNTRYEPLLYTLEVAKDNFFGLGNTGYDYFFRNSIQPSYDSFVQAFIRYGYALIILLVVCLTNIFIKDKVVFIILFLTFTSQGVWFTPLIALFYFLYFKKP